MAEEVEKCDMNNTLRLQNAFSVNAVKEDRQEEDFVDEKIEISETAVTTELQDNSMCEETKQYDKSAILDNIKTELPSSEVQYDIVHDKLKIEEGLNADEIKMEFNNGFLYCEHCQVYCEDYCRKCGMLAHILNRTIPINTDKILREELPNDILEIRDYCGEIRIFAVKDIPASVKFGPFTGLNRTELSWKIKRGKFLVNKEKSKYLNWMQHISPARNISEQNLLVFQYKHNLYYQSTRQIREGDELLVYFGEEYEDSLNRDVEMDFIPAEEHNIKDVFACTLCCLGFSSESYLAKHKAICPGNVDGGFSIEELVQCPFCEIHLGRNEYFTHHMAYCSEKNDGKCILPTLDHRTAQVTLRRTRPCQKYKCQQCKYRTQYKGDLKNHTKQHYEVKMYKCGICCRRYKTKEILRLHVESAHISRKGDLEHSAGINTNTRIKAEHSSPLNEMKRWQCSMCEFRTKYKASLKMHVAGKHLRKRNYTCDICNYKSNQKSNLKAHIKVKHLKQFNYNCDKCEYRTNQKSILRSHIETKHLKEFKYKCGACEYKTNWKSVLRSHIETRHLKEFKYKCDRCEYKTNTKHRLKMHTETIHLKVFKYNCDKCDYKTNEKSDLKNHIKARHLKEFKYKCDTCDYKTNRKSLFRRHVETSHLKEFKYKCDTCDYKTNWKSNLKIHVETRHLKVFKYKCDTCDYKTYRKYDLKTHIKTKHLEEFKYECDMCNYKTNMKGNIKKHIEKRHLKEFNYECETCEYRTNWKAALRSHIERRHLKELKYRCDTCEYKTNQPSLLKMHVEGQHLKEFKYKCDTCDYKTNRESYLKIHIDTKHLKVFKYKCDICDYKTNRKYDLKIHMETKHLK